jgi:hypothetical protein
MYNILKTIYRIQNGNDNWKSGRHFKRIRKVLWDSVKKDHLVKQSISMVLHIIWIILNSQMRKTKS